MRRCDDRLDSFLAGLDAAGRRRRPRPMESLPGCRVRLDGRELVNFSSNDYLGLSHHPLLVERAASWAARYGSGSGASRLVTGRHPILDALEERIARAKGSEATLVMASGWQCNAAVLSALLDAALWGETPLLFTDKLAHASMHAGIAASGVRQIRYRHGDLSHLAGLLRRHAGSTAPRIIVTETVFSMDGDVTDVAALMELARAHDAFVYLDEAHATGVLGPGGFGLCVGHGADLVMGTFSKALGCFGAYVACSARLKDYLINRCSGVIYSTALPPPLLGAMDAALDLVPRMDAERTWLRQSAARLRAACAEAGLSTGASATQIVPVILGDERRTLAASRVLEEEGLLGVAIRPPTVPEGASRIRLTLSAAHTENDIDRLVAAVSRLAGEGA